MKENVIGNQIALLRNRFGLTQEDLAVKLGYSKQTISNWETGLKIPRMGAIQKMSDLFNVSKSFIIEGDIPSSTILTIVTKTMSKLEEPRQKKVLTYAQAQLEEQEQGKILRPDFGSRDNAEKDVNVLGIMTAGRGTINDEKCAPIKTVRMYASDIPKHYDMAFEVKGHSMYPTFEDGEIIFVEKRTEVTNGMIGCVEINGDAFVKKMYVEEGKLRLVSLNNDYDNEGNRIYPDIYADEEDEIYIVGKVVN